MKKDILKFLLFIFVAALIGLGLWFFLKAEAPNRHVIEAVTTQKISQIGVLSEEVDNARKNVLLIIADDFGLDASPCHVGIGAEKPSMPHLERLCDKGVVMDEAWTAPTCTPTRATLLTGKYGKTTNVLAVDDVLVDQETIFDIATAQGYESAVIGKWHVSGRRAANSAPNDLGVPHYVGFLTGGLRDYFNFTSIENKKDVKVSQYSTSYFTDKAIEWVSSLEQEDDWFLWLAYNAPHTPFHVPPANLHSQSGLSESSSNQIKYFAALEALDTEMGRLLSVINEDETIIIFLGDNGTPGKVVQSPFSRTKAKGSLYQGGISVPMVIMNYDVSPQRPVVTVDLFSTIAKTFGHAASNVDGITLDQDRDFLYMDTQGKNGEYAYAVKKDDYKYIEHNNKEELYDLSNDISESQNAVIDDEEIKNLLKSNNL